jgi:hypothetical protein
VNLSNDDVRDILALLDGLPFDDGELETSHFRLVLHRDPSGAWTRETTLRSAQAVAELLALWREAVGDQGARAP